MKVDGSVPWRVSRRNRKTGIARSSSVRGVSCEVKSLNERNPRPVLNFSQETALVTGRKVGMTSDQRDLYALGYTRATMRRTKGC